MKKFEMFVLFAEMRTGSNYLESNLNAFDGITCHGEAFNPHFIGYPNADEILGITRDVRDANPKKLLRTIRQQDGAIGGFRYFHDHDARILDQVIDDRTCAKIILSRDTLESYVSWKIARSTGQWKLTDVKQRRADRVAFDLAEYAEFENAIRTFRATLIKRLQSSGQTAFFVSYPDIGDPDVINGIAQYLGLDERLDAPVQSLKRQNPDLLAEKVINPDQMRADLATYERADLGAAHTYEPRRGAAVPSYVAAAHTPLLFMPIKGAPNERVLHWLAAVDDVAQDALQTKFSQAALREWQQSHPGHRSFTVLDHPLARAHRVFCRRILSTGSGAYLAIRNTLRRREMITLPDDPSDQSYSIGAHRMAFVQFLSFLKANLAGQTAIRVDAEWASQAQILQSFGELALPDHILRSEELETGIKTLVPQNCPAPPDAERDSPYTLDAIYDSEIEEWSRRVYPRDYTLFGFRDWSAVT